MKTEKTSEKGKAWLKKELRPYRTFIFFLAVLSVAATLFSLSFAYMVRFLINSASDGSKQKMIVFSAVLLGVLFMKIFLHTLGGYLSEKARARITADLRTRLFCKILHSDYAKIQEYHSGELLTRLTSDIQEVASDSVGLLSGVATMVVQCMGAVVALLTIDPLFTLIYVICSVILAGISALFRKPIKRQHKEFLEADGEFRSFMQEGIASSLTVKAYGAEAKSTEKASKFAERYFGKRMTRNRLRSTMSGVFSLLSNIGMIFAVIWCSISVLLGNDDYGSILSVILLLMQLQQPLSSFSGIVPVYYARLTSGERLSEIDELATEQTEELNAQAVYAEMQEFSVENITFDYGREAVLADASITLNKGEIICITGASGTGKSTLFRLLLKVYTPKDGEIYVVGNDGSRVPISVGHRALFAYVPQGNFLFSGTIYENLTFFSTEKDEKILVKKVDEALRAACADFVFGLPDGVHTPLYERGAGLSEGQVQRLAVARALLSDRPILLLDEATSALDSETEEKLLKNVKAMENKTCIIVTHRPAALAIADTVLKVEKGKLYKTELTSNE